MKYYKVYKIMNYTEVCYIMAEDKDDAIEKSSEEEGIILKDDSWCGSYAIEVSKDEYEDDGEGNVY